MNDTLSLSFVNVEILLRVETNSCSLCETLGSHHERISPTRADRSRLRVLLRSDFDHSVHGYAVPSLWNDLAYSGVD